MEKRRRAKENGREGAIGNDKERPWNWKWGKSTIRRQVQGLSCL